MSMPRDHSRMPAVLAVTGVLLLTLAFLGLAREVIKLQGVRGREALRELVEADFQALQNRLQFLLERARGALASGSGRAAAVEPLVESSFQVAADGTFRQPPLNRFASVPPLSPEVQRWLRDVVAEARDLALEDRAPEGWDRLQRARAQCRDPACKAQVVYEAAVIGRQFQPLEMVRNQLEQVALDFPGAVGLDGLPLALLARLRLATLLREAGVPAELEKRILREILADLAAGAWDLDSFEEDYYLKLTLEKLNEPLPASLERVWRLVTLVRRYFLPRLSAGGWEVPAAGSGAPGESAPLQWAALPVRGRPLVAGYQPRLAGNSHELIGVILDLGVLREELERTAAGLLEGQGGFELRAAEAGEVLARLGERTAEEIAVERPLTLLGMGAFLRVFRPEPKPAWMERALPWAGLLVILLALGGGTLLAIQSLQKEVDLARLRREFLDTVSHELRTPLTSIRLNADLLGRRGLPAERAGVALEHIQEEALRLERMVSDILDISRIRRAGSTWMRPEPVSPGVLVEQALRSHRPGLQARGFEVAVEEEEGLPPVRADLEAAARALGNLIGNAAKYSGDSRRFAIQVQRCPEGVAFAVVDHGLGVPPGEEERIFRRFYRVPDTAAGVSGAGLGLAVAREIARGLGGDILLRPTPGGGATFIMVLRAAPVAGPGGESPARGGGG